MIDITMAQYFFILFLDLEILPSFCYPTILHCMPCHLTLAKNILYITTATINQKTDILHMTSTALCLCSFGILNFSSLTQWQIHCLFCIFHAIRTESGPVILSSNFGVFKIWCLQLRSFDGLGNLNKNPKLFLNLSSLWNWLESFQGTIWFVKFA